MTVDLLELVAADLPAHRLVRPVDGTSHLIPHDGGQPLQVSRHVRRRFLGRIEVARFEMAAPAPTDEAARLQVRHIGRLRRIGVGVEVLEGRVLAERLRKAMADDSGFTKAARSLDFTRFGLELDGTRWVASVELMGASLVLIAFPPIRSYVRLHPDQREALLESLASLDRLLARLFPSDCL